MSFYFKAQLNVNLYMLFFWNPLPGCAKSRAIAREKELYEQLLLELSHDLLALQTSAAAISQLDVLTNLTERALYLGWCAPKFDSSTGISIQDGRHPVVECSLEQPFIANDIDLHKACQMLLITGPNMGGKSTYMRQTALITLLAYIGSFVPAKSATLGPIDRIFTRIGASDDLASGRSTFMVEMTETANILHHATKESLVLIDEIGRGTSTFDGMSLAWACTQYIATNIQCFCLFATHYFELTQLADQFPAIFNVHVTALEENNEIIFLHKLAEGPINQSYGIHVAQLAGLPANVIEIAKAKCQQMEHVGQGTVKTIKPKATPKSRIQTFLESLAPDEMSPKEALSVLYKLHEMVKT